MTRAEAPRADPWDSCRRRNLRQERGPRRLLLRA